jgi:hypothetical protein
MPVWTANRYEKVPKDCRFGGYSEELYQPIEHPRRENRHTGVVVVAQEGTVTAFLYIAESVARQMH